MKESLFDGLKTVAPAAIALALAAMTTPAKANLLDFLFGGGGETRAVDCAVRDETCIRQAALDNAIAEFQARSHTPNIHPYVRYASQIILSAPDDMHDDIRNQWRDAGADDTFFEQLDDELRRLDSPPVDADAFARVLSTRQAPEGEESADYVRQAFSELRDTDPQAALALWNEHFLMLWEQAFGSVVDMHRWMAENDVDALEAYSAQFVMPRTPRYDPWEVLSYAAADGCAAGDIARGTRVLAVLELEMERWPPERDRRAIDSSKLTRAILACRGEDAAMATIDPMLDLMQTEIAAARQQFTDQTEQAFVVGVIESEVAENMIMPIALWLDEQGRRTEAIEVFRMLPPRASAMVLGDVVDGDVLSMEFMEQSFDEMIALYEDDELYSSEANVALTHYVEQFESDFSVCCADEDVPWRMLEDAGTLWPAEIAQRAAEKTITLYTDYAAREPGKQHLVDYATLTIAEIEHSHGGCDASDETLQAILNAAPSYRFDGQRVWVLLAYIDYLQSPRGTVEAGTCLVQ